MPGLDFLQGNSGKTDGDAGAEGFLGKAMPLARENTKRTAKQMVLRALLPVIVASLPYILGFVCIVVILLLGNEAVKNPAILVDFFF